MAFDFGSGGFGFGSGFQLGKTVENPLERVDYSGDIEADSLAEYEALLSGLEDAGEEHLLVFVFPERASLDSFMWRRHLNKQERFFPADKALRALLTPQANAGFSAGSGFSLKTAQAKDADDGWLERQANEKKRFELATDPEFYCVVHFDSSDALTSGVKRLGLDGLADLPVSGCIALSGPEVDSVLP